MRITVDQGRCEGHGRCENAAPQIFKLDDDGMLENFFEDQDLPVDVESAAVNAAAVCPVAALRIEQQTDLP
jgi:ferredoxin